MINWLITGGCGFIGTNLIARLLDTHPGKLRICVLDNFSASRVEEFRQGFPGATIHLTGPTEFEWRSAAPIVVVKGDVRNPDDVGAVSIGADILVHLAANTGVAPSVADPRADCQANVIGTLNCLEAARVNHIKRFVFASSGAPAGLCEPPVSETIVPRPASPYGASKLAGEAYCCAYANSFGVETVALRFSNVYGPYSWRKGSVVATFIKQAISGQPISINGDGCQTRDFIYVGDLVGAVVLAAQKPGLGGELFQVATGCETSVNELVGLLNGKLVRRGMPALHAVQGERSSADVLRSFADISKVRKILGWHPEKMLDEGLDMTLDWFEDSKLLQLTV